MKVLFKFNVKMSLACLRKDYVRLITSYLSTKETLILSRTCILIKKNILSFPLDLLFYYFYLSSTEKFFSTSKILYANRLNIRIKNADCDLLCLAPYIGPLKELILFEEQLLVRKTVFDLSLLENSSLEELILKIGLVNLGSLTTINTLQYLTLVDGFPPIKDHVAQLAEIIAQPKFKLLTIKGVNDIIFPYPAKVSQFKQESLIGQFHYSGKGIALESVYNFDLFLLLIEPLLQNKEITYFSLRNNLYLSDIICVKCCPQIRVLNLAECPTLQDITPLYNCPHLVEINFTNCVSLEDITPLKNRPNLTKINFTKCISLEDITPLKNCLNLLEINFSGCAALTNITALGMCTKLAKLNFSNCFYLEDITPLDNCTLLVELNLKGCDLLNRVDVITKYKLFLQ